MKKLIFLFVVTMSVLATLNLSAQQKFMWGVASASYQVEGAYNKDGKGESNWDVYTNKYHITEKFTGVNQTGNVSVNQYDRVQYLKDFALMKKLGVNTYRFSIAWSRLLPEGTGKINQKGIDHYKKFIDDLLSFGIEPAITLFHWDLPQALQAKGGWDNPESVKWFEAYSNLVFKSFGKKVKTYITFNEPYIDLFLITTTANNIINKKTNPFGTSNEEFSARAVASHNLLTASAVAIRNYHAMHLGGQIGITLSLSPTIPKNSNNAGDVKAAFLQDGVHNKWFLDGSLKGTYPKEIVELYKQYAPGFNPPETDMKVMQENRPDFIGVNFYAPCFVSWDKNFPMNINWMTNNPDSIKMFNGTVKPEYLYKLLMRIKDEYNNPVILITENGAGFGDRDEQLVNGNVNDSLRTDYVKRHIDIAMKAKADGANLQGYMLWSILDNFEWLWGYDKRFGIVYVDFKTQQRTPKKSFYEYQQIIKNYNKK